MCNSLHSDSKPIPKSGFGYKLFENNVNGEVRPVFGSTGAYVRGKGNWVKWLPGLYWDGKKVTEHNYGFCFFRTRKGVERLLAACRKDGGKYSDCRILKIQYRKGLGCHQEDGIVTGKVFTTSICKEFKILD